MSAIRDEPKCTGGPGVEIADDGLRKGRPMTHKQARKHLAKMLKSITQGSILHLLAEVFQHEAEQARLANDATLYEQLRLVEHTLFVVGLGLDAAWPR